jgi:diaminohydroxyphosphoribosylaminopyrimidine deaminase/5-amino-6-(5-phosphoribosylamino)uracil reductase
MTLNGQIATARGESQWITGEAARSHVHQLRAQVDAVLVGIGTVLRDNPSLTARPLQQGMPLALRQPLRVLVDSRLRVPVSAQALRDQGIAHTLIATTSLAAPSKIRRLTELGVDVATLPRAKGRVDLAALWRKLGQLGITSLLVEGGSEMNAAVLNAGLAQRIMWYQAPLLLGGQDSKGVLGGASPARLKQAWRVAHVRTQPLGRDILITADVVSR